jgi:hypothetical protein
MKEIEEVLERITIPDDVLTFSSNSGHKLF